MKTIKLAGPTSVDTGNPPRGFAELRHPIEGPLLVHDDEAQRLKTNKLLDGEPDDVPDTDDENEVPDDLKDMKVADLKAKALKDGVPLHDATTKPAVIAAFVAHRAAQA